ncbi:MAG TPA: PilC/PilY family type IV pilus protein [Lysobacter sp.]|nr:PilC/PilY family type IV pilus protein [Lysobacter sp.]
MTTMTPARRTSLGLAVLVVAGGLSYWTYSANAVQGQGVLAQAPLNIQSSVAPAFMMAVDDSGSMTFEMLFPGQDGEACYSGGSFFTGPGVPRASGGTCDYHHLIPYEGYRIDTNRHAVPPLDKLGAARSPAYNPQYFNPAVEYVPWVNQDGSQYPDSEAAAAKIDVRKAATINLVEDRAVAGNADLYFRVLNGMVIPRGTRYYKTANCGGLSGGNNQWVSSNSDQTLTGTCNIGIEYYPATFYLPEPVPAPAGYRTDRRDLIQDACGAGCNLYKYEIRPSNYSPSSAYDAAARSFANWFTYYGNRNRAMIAGMTQSLVDINNMRIGYLRINQHASYDNPVGSAGERVTMRDMAVTSDRVNLYTSLVALPASGSTPNRQAVNAAAIQFTRTDSGAPIQYACQKNAVMLFTDGYSNQDGPTVGNVDGGMGAPFSDGWSNTLADIASQYYLNSNGTVGAAGASALRPTMSAGKVPVPQACNAPNPDPKLDCQSNLHINFYGVTLGARGNIYNALLDQDAYTDSSVYANWPSRQNDNPSTVDDIWHAATNTRGEYINARTPRDITDAMRRILASVGGGETPSGSLALTGARVGEGSFSVEPLYASANSGTDWYSTLTAYGLSTNNLTGQVYQSVLWEAAAKLPAAGSRRIFVGKTSGNVRPTVTTFDTTNVALADLCSDTLSRCTAAGTARNSINSLGVNQAEAIAYLRGDQSLENSTSKPLRRRTTRLGDIVNSSPLIVSPLNDYGYRSLGGTDPYNYAAYLESKKARKPMVYVGANDGMLHAFHGETGVEQFAYVPVASLGHMGNLLFPYRAEDKDDQVFTHRYYVDGPINVSDAYYTGSWKTVLVGALGAGGRGVFSLNISAPTSFGTGEVLWDINDRSSDVNVKNNIGNVLAKPVIVPVKVGNTVSWKAIFGNGYNSINNRAVLFIVDVATGAVTTVQAAEAGYTGPNGLGEVIVLDRFVGSTATTGRDGYADTVYAGDQNGAVWKFDLRSATPTAQTTPFFAAVDSAGNRQAITGGFEAAAGPRGGVMLYFGTGSFSFVNDPTDKQVQTFYSVLDTGTSVTRADLQQQSVLTQATGSRTTSMLAMGASKKGWYIDLLVGTVGTGERFVGTPRVESGIVFFTTFDPNSTDACATGGTNRLYGLSALNGAAALSYVRVGTPDGATPGTGTGAINLSTTGSAPVRDIAVLTSSRQGLLPDTATAADVNKALDARCMMVVQTPGSQPLYLRRPCGRQSWRQVR